MIDACCWLRSQKSDSVLIILNQDITEPKLFDLAWNASKWHIVTDGAANRLLKLNNEKYVPDIIVGDFDSALPESLEHYKKLGTKIVHDPDQYSTDFMKAMKQSHLHFSKEPLSFLAFNALGGRVDHCWHSYLCLSLAAEKGDHLVLISNENITFLLQPGEHTVATPRDLLEECCGYAPIHGPTVVSTKGFEWDVTDATVSFSTFLSTSNHIRSDEIYIKTDKPLLFTVNFKPIH